MSLEHIAATKTKKKRNGYGTQKKSDENENKGRPPPVYSHKGTTHDSAIHGRTTCGRDYDGCTTTNIRVNRTESMTTFSHPGQQDPRMRTFRAKANETALYGEVPNKSTRSKATS